MINLRLLPSPHQISPHPHQRKGALEMERDQRAYAEEDGEHDEQAGHKPIGKISQAVRPKSKHVGIALQNY